MSRLDDIVARNQRAEAGHAVAAKISIPLVVALLGGGGWFASMKACSRDDKLSRWCDAAEGWLSSANTRVDTVTTCAAFDDIYVQSRDGILPQLEAEDTRLEAVRSEVVHIRNYWGCKGEPLRWAVQLAHESLQPALARVRGACRGKVGT